MKGTAVVSFLWLDRLATCNCDLTCCTFNAQDLFRIHEWRPQAKQDVQHVETDCTHNVFPIEVKTPQISLMGEGQGAAALICQQPMPFHVLSSGSRACFFPSFHYSLDRNRKSEQGPTCLEITTNMTDKSVVENCSLFVFQLTRGVKMFNNSCEQNSRKHPEAFTKM